MIRRLMPIVLGLALLAGVVTPAGASPRSASATSVAPGGTQPAPGPDQLNPNGVPPPDPSHLATIPAVLKYTTGKRIGPNSYTENGSFVITGFYLDSTGGYVRTRSGVTYGNPLIAAAASSGPRSGAAIVTPDSWYNPTSWDWGHILGTAWNAMWNGCLKGSVDGLVGEAGGTLMVNLIARGGKVVPGPYGYAAVAIGGCLVAALNY